MTIVLLLGILGPLALAIFFAINSLIMAAVGASVAGIVIFLLFRALKPLDDLVKGVETLASGNLNFRLDIRSGDELEKAGESFNKLAEILKQSTEKLEEGKDIISAERNKLSTIVSSVIDGIIAVDLSKNVVLVNKAAQYMTGYTPQEMEGKPIDQLIRLYKDQEEIPAKSYCQIAFLQNSSSRIFQSLTLMGKEGKAIRVNLATSAAAGEVETNLGCILILHDLTYENQLEQMRLDFVSMASHELRTPLTSIIGYLSVFIDENKQNLKKDQLDLLERSLISAKQLLTLIGNILSVNKIEREQLNISIEPIDLDSIIPKAVDDLQNQAKIKNIILNFTKQGPLPKVLADGVRISEVINNLVGNAINYTDAGGRVIVSTQATPNEVIVTVEDTGVGIPKEAIPHLFNKFFRVSNSLQKGSKGTGLGLYISKSIIQSLNGKIWVESEVGKGSKFHFSLPIAREANLGAIDRNRFVGETIQSGGLNY